MERPRCPRPGHELGRVVRNGTYGTGTHRRPRWKCYPPNDDAPHEFTEALPRQFGASGFCGECERPYDESEGPQTPRAYSFTTKQIAGALERLGRGDSYCSVSWAVRRQAQRFPQSRNARRPRLTSHGQLAADFVEVFAPVVFQPFRRWDWPAAGSLLLDAVHFRVNTGVQGGAPAFCVLAAMGYDPELNRQVLWHLQAVPGDQWGPTASEWALFLKAMGGQPQRVVSDQDDKLMSAARAVWPDGDIYLCEQHLHAAAAKRLRELGFGDPTLPVRHKLDNAFRSQREWDDFKAEALALHHPDLRRYIKRLDRIVVSQFARRPWVTASNPVSTGALEERLRELRAGIGSRSGRMLNQERLNRLLMLFQLELNRQADAGIYARAIHDWLLVNHGRPRLRRRAIADVGNVHALGAP